jgi:hypothetical protein
MSKTYTNMREQMELNELSLGRAGGTLFFASQVRQDGQRLEQTIVKAKGKFSSSKSSKSIEDKLDYLVDGMTEISNAIYLQRRMIGSLTGVSLSSALTSGRTDKQMIKLMKGRK